MRQAHPSYSWSPIGFVISSPRLLLSLLFGRPSFSLSEGFAAQSCGSGYFSDAHADPVSFVKGPFPLLTLLLDLPGSSLLSSARLGQFLVFSRTTLWLDGLLWLSAVAFPVITIRMCRIRSESALGWVCIFRRQRRFSHWHRFPCHL